MRTITGFLMKIAPHIFVFTLLSASLGSCSNADKTADAGIPEGAAPVKTEANTAYRTPSIKGPVPRNPDMKLSANFSPNAGVTISRVAVSQNYVAMTFDDGPHPQNTPKLLDILRERNIKATFYVIGRNVDLYPAITRRIVAEGHEIGNHTYTHGNMTKMSDSKVREELDKCREAIARAAGVKPRTLRPPYGALLQNQRSWIHSEYGYPTIMWAVDPRDWQRPGPSVVTSRILSATTPGAIVLAHDLHAPTVTAMPATLDGLLRKGYKFVTVSQLLAMKPKETPAQAASTPAP
ncbi:polysaccharide deacetylase family protein [Haloferula chungangensis]|uniref:Polysaccharide deacetylase family protein n=1 Tax=Haloferula chungangensis TaxID=1048331 RepID=A0ABW2L6X5_9BACT